MTTHYYNTPKTTENSSGAVAMLTQENVMPRHNNVPQVNAPSIGSSAMLVELTISQWTARKKDKKASAEVTADTFVTDRAVLQVSPDYDRFGSTVAR